MPKYCTFLYYQSLDIIKKVSKSGHFTLEKRKNSAILAWKKGVNRAILPWKKGKICFKILKNRG